jgi:outer membrane receptor protein involved in Fe transport
MEIGFIGTDLHYNLEDDRLNNAGKLVNYLKENDHAYFLQAFVQWKKRIHPRWVSTWGLHSYQFLLNGARTLEPRGSLQYTNSLSGKLSLGFGLHSRLEPVSVYLFKRYLTNGTSVQPNRELEPGKSFHYILSYEHPLNKNTRLKLEAYFQDLKQVPIDSSLNSTYTLLNSGGGIPSNVLLNKGFGKNKGLELTLEKFYTKQFYYLLTASVFDSKYKNQNGQWHNTVYNDRYAFNFLIGKEFTLPKHRSFALNIRYMHRGGNRFTPILLAESIKKNTTILDASRIYEDQYPDFRRCDLSFSYKINKKQSLWSMGMDIQNLTNRINIISQQFDIASKSIRNSIALPRIPIFFIRTEF